MLDVRRGLEPSDRQKAMVLKALVDDLSFWGDLTTVAAETSTPTSKSTGTAVSAASTQLSATQVQTAKETRSTTSQSSWKIAVDATSGKTYYYDVVTRRTQWEKVSCHDSRFDPFSLS